MVLKKIFIKQLKKVFILKKKDIDKSVVGGDIIFKKSTNIVGVEENERFKRV